MNPNNAANPSSLTDLQLISICSDPQEDPACWAEFVRRYQSVLSRSVASSYRRFTRGLYPPAWRVAELVQEVYLRLLKKERVLLRRFRGVTETSAKAYFSHIAANTTGDILRQELAQKRLCETSSLETTLLSGQLLNQSQRFSFPEGLADRDLIRLLSHSSRGENAHRDAMIFLLHCRVGLTAQEIADTNLFKLQPASVMSILIRTRVRLKKAMGGVGSFL